MDYPHGFPAHLQPEVDAAFADADVEFLEAAGDPNSFGYRNRVEPLLGKYVSKCFFAFAKQARKAGSEGTWSGEQIRREVDEFLRRLIIHVIYARHPSTFNASDSHRSEIAKWIKQSNEWKEHQRKLARIAKAQTSRRIRKSAHTATADSISEKRKKFVEPLLDKKVGQSSIGQMKLK